MSVLLVHQAQELGAVPHISSGKQTSLAHRRFFSKVLLNLGNVNNGSPSLKVVFSKTISLS